MAQNNRRLVTNQDELKRLMEQERRMMSGQVRYLIFISSRV